MVSIMVIGLIGGSMALLGMVLFLYSYADLRRERRGERMWYGKALNRRDFFSGACAMAVGLTVCGYAAVSFSHYKAHHDSLDRAPVSDEVREEVQWSRPVAAFDQAPSGDARVAGRLTGLSFARMVRLDVNGDPTIDYVVMEDRRGDGGLIQAAYPGDKTVIYENATPEDARVELVEIEGEIKKFDCPVHGAEERVGRRETEYRIHIPEGTLDVNRIPRDGGK